MSYEKIYPSSGQNILMWHGQCVNEMSRQQMIDVIADLGKLHNQSIEMHREHRNTMSELFKKQAALIKQF